MSKVERKMVKDKAKGAGAAAGGSAKQAPLNFVVKPLKAPAPAAAEAEAPAAPAAAAPEAPAEGAEAMES